MTHLTFEEISDLAERRDDGAAATHLAECESCRATLAGVRGLLATAQALPRDIAPPPQVWNALRARVASEARVRSTHQRRWWHNGWLAAAAAVVLIAGTMTLTTLLASRGKAAKAKPPQGISTPSSMALLAVDRNYVATIGELRATLDAQRAQLSPATIATLERSLAVIDAAIAEARAALAADPANQALLDILAAHYERKVDFLQRAAELSSSL